MSKSTKKECSCPQWDEQSGWDPGCSTHGFDWSTSCEDGAHIQGRESYGRTTRGGVKVVCQKCGAPLELHPDDSPPTYTEGW